MPADATPQDPAWVRRLLDDLDAADATADAVARTISYEQLTWKPHAHSWSIGQCLLHLLNTNQVYLPPIARALEGRPAGTAREITPGPFGAWFLRTYIEPETQKRRARSPRKVAPSPQIDRDVLDQFLRSNRDVRALVRRAAGYDVNRIRFVNPFVPVIRFTVGTGLQIVARHEHRHLLQAERIKARLGPNPLHAI